MAAEVDPLSIPQRLDLDRLVVARFGYPGAPGRTPGVADNVHVHVKFAVARFDLADAMAALVDVVGELDPARIGIPVEGGRARLAALAVSLGEATADDQATVELHS